MSGMRKFKLSWCFLAALCAVVLSESENGTTSITTPDNPRLTTPDNPPVTTPDNPQVTTPDNPPVTTPDNPPVTTPDNPPVTTPDNPPVTTHGNPPVTTPDNPPVTTPQSRPPTTPQSRPRRTPQSRPPTTPQSRPPTTPQSRHPTTPQSRPPTTPQSRPPTTPQSRPPTTPLSRPPTTPPVTTPDNPPVTTPDNSPVTTPDNPPVNSAYNYNPQAPYGYRAGKATRTNSCQHVRAVPSRLRSASVMKPNGLTRFYQKYTEAYGIPVVSSGRVPDDALRRACYTLRFLLAGHSAVRNNFYKLFGRVAVIGQNEGTNWIPEHSNLPGWWNKRARGLGATPFQPVSSGGEENVLCYTDDRYPNEDIYLHESSHGVHLLGAAPGISGWDRRLRNLYSMAKRTGLWAYTYSMSTAEEYFAEGVQSYFFVNTHRDTPNGIHGPISTRPKLKSYDPALYKLIQEAFPCDNVYLKRCESTREKERNQVLKMDCDLFGPGGRPTKSTTTTTTTKRTPSTTTTTTTPSKPTTETTTGCTGSTENATTVSTPSTENATTVSTPSTDNATTVSTDSTQSPTTAGTSSAKTSESFSTSTATATSSSATTTTSTTPTTTTTSGRVTHCRDYNHLCYTWSLSGQCYLNPGYMNLYCRKSCRKCGVVCGDQNVNCQYWAIIGECYRNPDYMNTNCNKSCGKC